MGAAVLERKENEEGKKSWKHISFFKERYIVTIFIFLVSLLLITHFFLPVSYYHIFLAYFRLVTHVFLGKKCEKKHKKRLCDEQILLENIFRSDI